jgi:predicted component of type VI protein secretion system
MRITTQQRIRLCLMWVALALAWNGCASLGKEPIKRKVAESEQALPTGAKTTIPGDTRSPKEEKAGPFQKSTRFVHRVQWPGETISIIAKWYTGKLENWKAIVKANPKLKPSRIFIGSKIHIPENLLETREPMPQEFLARFTPKPKKKTSPFKRSDTRSPNEKKARPFQKSTRFVHRVQWPQETLAIIAKWYTGKLENWKAIAKANPKLKPSRILVGNKIHIPEDLLAIREPMPQEFLMEFTSKPKKKRAASKSTPPPEEETEPVLFGPKEYPKK